MMCVFCGKEGATKNAVDEYPMHDHCVWRVFEEGMKRENMLD